MCFFYYLLPPPSSLLLWRYYMAQDYTLSSLSPSLPPPILSQSIARAVLLNHSSLSHCRLWDVGQPVTPLVETIAHHSEFTFGLDFSPLAPGKVSPFSSYTVSYPVHWETVWEWNQIFLIEILAKLIHCTFIIEHVTADQSYFSHIASLYFHHRAYDCRPIIF